ncbi:MAG: DSD1 family PLP-dependent enzyme [Burkholderiales bacterium]
MTRPPAEIGMALEDVDTPALLIELDALERNLRRLPESLIGKPVRIRPHAKTHKSPIIALKQIELGAIGVCCQKVSEAEAMVDGGVRDVFVSNEIVGAQKLARLGQLATRAKIGVAVDDAQNLPDLSAAAKKHGAQLDLYIEINVGTPRCGVMPGHPALVLAKIIAGSEHLRFAGLHAYHGKAQHLRTYADRRANIHAASSHALETKQLLEKNGIACPIITGAGTGTYLFEAASKVYNEIQPGSYVFMDADYGRNRAEDGEVFVQFENSLCVWTTVMSKPAADRAVVDAGLKAHSVDSGMPTVVGYPGVEYVGASDEHGVLKISNPGSSLKLGDKIKLIPGHCDPTVNLYDWYVCVRNGIVEHLWPITARGAVY